MIALIKVPKYNLGTFIFKISEQIALAYTAKQKKPLYLAQIKQYKYLAIYILHSIL